jgi:hypothetical protein
MDTDTPRERMTLSILSKSSGSETYYTTITPRSQSVHSLNYRAAFDKMAGYT